MEQRLGSILVRGRRLAFRQLDAAQQRQRREGGALDTCLLELGHLDEVELTGYMAEAAEIAAFDLGALPRLDASLVREAGLDEVRRSGILPLHRHDGRCLALVSRVPLAADIERMSALLGATLELRVSVEFRWNTLLAHLAAEAADERTAALAARFPIDFSTEGPSSQPAASARVNGQGRPVAVDDGSFGSRNWSLDELTSYFERSTSRDDVLRATVGFVGNVLARRMVLIPSSGRLHGFDAAGFEEQNQTVTRLDVAAEPGSVLARVVSESTYYFGGFEASGASSIYQAAGVDAPAEIALVPVKLGRRVALVIAGDNGADPVDPRLIPLLFVVAGRLGSALETQIRRRKKSADNDAHAQAAPSSAPEARAAAQEANNRVLERLKRANAVLSSGTGTLPDDGWELPVTSTEISTVPAAPESVSPTTRPTSSPTTRPSAPVGSTTQPMQSASSSTPSPVGSPANSRVDSAATASPADPNQTQIIADAARATRQAIAAAPAPTSESGLLLIDLEPVDVHPLSRVSSTADNAVVSTATSPLPALMPLGAARSAEDEALRARVGALTHAELVSLLGSPSAGVPETAQAELHLRGAAAHAAMMTAFPGPILPGNIDVSPLETPIERHGPLVHLVLLRASDLVDSLEQHVHSGSSTQRFYALSILWRIHAASSPQLAVQHLLDDDDLVRLLCVRIIEQSRDVAIRSSAERRTHSGLNAADSHVVERAIGVCHALRLASTVPRMIELLDANNVEISARAHATLVRITLRDLGTTSRRWDTWLHRQAQLDRGRWLLDAMVDSDRKVRENAQRELRQLSGIVVNYTPDLDARSLLAAQRAVAQKLGVRLP